ncbi:MAG: hypothetical protein AMS27_13360 [Bacteroides sp. SM23_62_1]|nr:MAG: hypothetical protein AMS27_13360 [Bacteroides sp. SM23_62_1]
MTQVKIPPGQPDKLIWHIERVAEKMKASKLNESRVNSVKYSLEQISGFLGCNQIQALMFSIILVLNFKNQKVDIYDIARFIDCNPLKIAGYIPDIEELEKRRIIRSDHDGKKRRALLNDIGFFVTRDVMDGVFRNNIPFFDKKEGLNMVELLVEINELIEDRENQKLTYYELTNDVSDLLSSNKANLFVRKIHQFHIELDELLLLLYVCFETINGKPEVDLEQATEKIYDDLNLRFHVKRNLVQGTSELIRKDIMKLQEGYFRNDRDILLTERACDLLFEENSEVITSSKKVRNIIMPEKIESIKLFFNTDESDRLDFLQQSLMDQNFRKIYSRLKNSKFSTGFTVLFYGIPGTGKTESVYQIAKKTGRGIMKVEISQTKSMWYGESEKRIKDIFITYKKALKQEKRCPILLFNEADGILGRRREFSNSAIDQTENAMQNILLQEMEDFTGILIATTNLTVNLDKAFDRRFLYKIRFEKPGVDVRAQIWKSKIPVLSKRAAKDLAGEFDFTGGQIDNIVRKFMTEDILNSRRPGIERIREFCLDETLVGGERRRIGF